MKAITTACAAFTALVAILLAADPGVCALKVWIDVQGYVIYRNEQGDVVKTPFNRYRDILYSGGVGGSPGKDIGHFSCDFDMIQRQIPITSIRDIVLYTANENANVIKYGPDGGLKLNALLTNREGQVHSIYLADDIGYSLTGADSLELSFYDVITGQYATGFVPGHAIEEIHFTSMPIISDPSAQNIASDPKLVAVPDMASDHPGVFK